MNKGQVFMEVSEAASPLAGNSFQHVAIADLFKELRPCWSPFQVQGATRRLLRL